MPPPDSIEQSSGFRSSMNWLHTWAGLVVGSLLFVIFWTGTLAVFDREIDRWTMPSTRLPVSPFNPDLAIAAMNKQFPTASSWGLDLPTHRAPASKAYVRFPDGSSTVTYLDPSSGTNLGDPGTKGGTGFFYPYHFMLHISAFNIGLLICALAALIMMVLCVSGVIVHKHIIRNFFSLRTEANAQRTVLDIHNLSGVLLLPFHFVIAFSGIALFGMMYVPAAETLIFKGNPAEMDAAYFSRAAAGEPGEDSVSVAPLIERARARWEGDDPKRISLYHPGDANAYFELQRSSKNSVAYRYDSIWFDAATGEMLMATENTTATETYHTIAGLHLVQFDHPLLRGLYFFAGLAGCVLIATGFIFWIEARRKRYEQLGGYGLKLVQGLAVGSVTGVIAASIAFMIANRVIPGDVVGRAGLEMWVFHLTWLVAIGHAFLRTESAWREQCWAIAASAILAVLLNGLTTGDWIPLSLIRGQTAVAGVDAFMLLGGFGAMFIALRLSTHLEREQGRRMILSRQA